MPQTIAADARSETLDGRVPVQLVDCDVHAMPRSWDELLAYVPRNRREEGWLRRVALAPGLYQPLNEPVRESFRGARMDAAPEHGPAGSDPQLLEKQLFDTAGVDLAVLLPLMAPGMANPEQETVLRNAMNEWLAETWLSAHNGHGRYRGSIHVVPARADLAAKEIKRWKDHPSVVQVMLDPYLADPLGQHQNRELLHAAADAGLPVALHLNRSPGVACLSPVGFASYYAEFHPNFTMAYIPHLVSLLFEGVFDELPDLRVVLVEGGVSWIAPLMWRLDHYWRQYRSEIPKVRRAPSEYFGKHVRFTTQPIEEPQPHTRLHQSIEWLDERLLMFSSDYPHWDFDNPVFVARKLPARVRSRVLAENAIELYDLPTTREEESRG